MRQKPNVVNGLIHACPQVLVNVVNRCLLIYCHPPAAHALFAFLVVAMAVINSCIKSFMTSVSVGVWQVMCAWDSAFFVGLLGSRFDLP